MFSSCSKLRKAVYDYLVWFEERLLPSLRVVSAFTSALTLLAH